MGKDRFVVIKKFGYIANYGAPTIYVPSRNPMPGALKKPGVSTGLCLLYFTTEC